LKSDKEKIKQYLSIKGLSRNSFYVKTGLSIGYLDAVGTITVTNLKKILDNYRDFNLDWFLFDKGEPVREINYDSIDTENMSLAEAESVYSIIEAKNELIEVLNKQLRDKEKIIKLLEKKK
tara:strand:+ start:2265 stop:2627 length:363 start_codon:yes stop_codon:yes gene_type:complete